MKRIGVYLAKNRSCKTLISISNTRHVGPDLVFKIPEQLLIKGAKSDKILNWLWRERNMSEIGIDTSGIPQQL